jgi:addiction module RelB/DinJ family antitoxin
MSNKENLNIRIDKEIKQHLNAVLKSNGMTISEAVRLYIWQIVTQGGIPFKGFISTKLQPKTGQLSHLDHTFNHLSGTLRVKLLQKQLDELDPPQAPPEPLIPDNDEDRAICTRFVKRYLEEYGVAFVLTKLGFEFPVAPPPVEELPSEMEAEAQLSL